MQFKSDKISAASKTKPQRPLDYSSTSVRLRLMSLVVALGIVVLAMNEARKPETWEKFGFGGSESSATAEDSDTAKTRVDNINTKLDNAPLNYSRWLDSLFYRLDADELTAINELINASNLESEADTESLKRAITQLGRDLAFDENPETQNEEHDLVKKILEYPVAQKLELTPTQKQLVSAAIFDRSLEFVEDRSSMNRSIERLAWNLTWRSLMETQASTNDAITIDYLQLSGQPSAYRGKTIQFDADVRGLQKIALPENHPLGLDAYYVFWMKPGDSGHTPYCVYTGKLPAGFDDPGNSFQTLNQRVNVNGRFFKLRSYEATNHQIEICPLIIAGQIRPVATKVSIAQSEPWRPPRWLFLTFLICMPLVAISMAYSVYQSTKTRQRSFDGATVGKSLKSLSEDGSIKSDRENINDLYDSEL